MFFSDRSFYHMEDSRPVREKDAKNMALLEGMLDLESTGIGVVKEFVHFKRSLRQSSTHMKMKR